MRIFLQRHAESIANELGVWTGQSNPGLSERGVAAQLAHCSRFDYPKGDIYFSSPLRRCLDSLAIVHGRSANLCVLPEFIECSLGSLEGKKYTNLNDDTNYISWVKKPDSRPHGGESFNEFTSRARSGFLMMIKIAAEHGAQSVVAVLHGNVMRAVLHGFVDSSLPHPRWEIPNCGGYLFEFERLSPPLLYEKIPGFLFDMPLTVQDNRLK